MSDELRGVDRWIEREDSDGYPPQSFSPAWVECLTCLREGRVPDDTQVGQRRCRRCGSQDIKSRGGQPRRRRHYDE